MPPYLFVDTAAWLALADADDRFHHAATRTFSSVAERRWNLVTTNLVVAEAYAGIRRRLHHRAAVSFLDRLARASRLERVLSTRELEETAEAIVRQYADQDFSYVDAVSFAVMRQRGIQEAFTFDQHFEAAGFAVVPEA
ncbi:MAG: PIN domain-containing protein [Chloroflexi bacterium]|nr:PIN domain-containing protein [Chloroflexota bacterium]